MYAGSKMVPCIQQLDVCVCVRCVWVVPCVQLPVAGSICVCTLCVDGPLCTAGGGMCVRCVWVVPCVQQLKVCGYTVCG